MRIFALRAVDGFVYRRAQKKEKLRKSNIIETLNKNKSRIRAFKRENDVAKMKTGGICAADRRLRRSVAAQADSGVPAVRNDNVSIRAGEKSRRPP